MKLSVLLLSAASVANAWMPSTVSSTASRTTRAGITARSAALTDGAVTLDGNEIRGPITPLGNLVLVKVKDTLTATGGGILLPDQSQERPTEGLVMEAGPGKLHPITGVRIENPVKSGMSVLYGKFDGRAVEYKGDECQYIRDDDVLLYYTGVTMNYATATPVRDYVLVELPKDSSDKQLQTKSGVVIAASVMKDTSPCQGRVVKIGEGRMDSLGKLATSPVQPGDLVKFKDYAGNEVMIEGKLYSVVKMVNILCTLPQPAEEVA
jgi:chaperonin GroES